MYAKIRIRRPGTNVWIYPLASYVAKDIVAPYIYYSRPADGVSCADPDGYLSIEILDEENLVVKASIDAYVEGNWAYNGLSDTFKSPYNGSDSSITAITIDEQSGYRLNIDKTSDWNASVEVSIFADDDQGNSLSTSWTFAPDLTAPIIDGYSTSEACAGTTILFNLTKDTLCSVADSDTIDAYVDSTLAIENGVFQSGFNGPLSTITPITDGYQVVIDSTSYYDTSVSVDAYGADEYGNTVGVHWDFAIDMTPPVLDGYSTAEACAGALILFDLTSAGACSVVAENSIDAYVDGSLAIEDGVFQSGFNGPLSAITVIEDGYQVTIDATSLYSSTVTVDAYGADGYGHTIHVQWNFDIDTDPPTIAGGSPTSYSCAATLVGFNVISSGACSLVTSDSIDAYVDGYWAIRYGQFADSYDGPLSAITWNGVDGYSVVIDNLSLYASTPVTIDAYAEDAYGFRQWSHWTFSLDITAPTIDGYYPAAGATGVDPGTLIYFDVTDSEMGMANLGASIDAYVDGNLAFENGVFQSGYNGGGSSVFGITDGYRIYIQTTADLSATSHTIDAYADDACINSSHATWDFTVTDLDGGDCILHVPFDTFGISKLSNKMTINGTSNWPSMCYFGKDASDPSWDAHDSYGGQLDLTQRGTGGTKPSQVNYPATDEHRGIYSRWPSQHNGWAYECDDTTTGNVSTNDFVFEIIWKPSLTSLAGTNYMLMKRQLGTPYQGYRFFASKTSGGGQFRVDLGATEIGVSSPTNTGWQHVLVFGDRNGGAGNNLVLYCNGVFSDSHDGLSTADLDNSDELVIFGDWTGQLGIGTVALIRMWQGAGWMAGAGNRDEWDKIAAERFAQLTGTDIDGYAANCDGYLNTHTRSASAITGILHNGVREMHEVCSNWPRVELSFEADGTDAYGLINEHAATNLFPYSEDHTSEWQADGVGVTLNNATAPWKEIQSDSSSATKATKLAEDASTGLHGIYDEVDLTASYRYVLSVFAKAINRDWLCLSRSGTIDGYFDLGNGETGTFTGCTGGMEMWGDDWYRCWITWAETAGSSHNLGVWAASADGTNSYAGASQDSIYIFGSQLEYHLFGTPTSYIPTEGATATRNTERMTIELSGLNDGYGTYECQVLGPNASVYADKYVMSLSDGGADGLGLLINDSSYFEAVGHESTAATDVSLVGTTDILDGYWATGRVYMRNQRNQLYVNGSLEDFDGTGTPVRNANTVELGSDRVGQNQSCLMINEIKVWDGYNKP